MKAVITILLIVVVALLALAFTCPDEASFQRYLAKLDDRQAGNLLEEARDSVLSAQQKLSADYQDHVLWATVETRRGTDRRSYLGVFGIWLELDGG